jgi:hypothetical protein
MAKGYSIASEKFLESIGKLLGNAPITQIPACKKLLQAGCDEKSWK